MNHLIQRASPLALAVALVSASLLIAFALPTPAHAAVLPQAHSVHEVQVIQQVAPATSAGTPLRARRHGQDGIIARHVPTQEQESALRPRPAAPSARRLPQQ